MDNFKREALINKFYELNKKPFDNSNEMKNIIYELTGNKLFKYRYGTLNDIINLLNNELPFSSANTLNDPFECEYRFKGIEEEYENSEYYWESVKRHLEDFKAETHICSFSEKNDDILMWAHYADDHKGFCLEYAYDELFVCRHQIIFPVIYTKKLPLVNSKEASEALKVGYTKAKNWEYEAEWRISELSNINEKYMLLNVPKPKAIYLGCKIEEGLKKYLITFCKGNDISIYISEKNKKEYKLDFKQIK